MDKHGSHRVWTQGAVLFIEAWGPWNELAALEFSQAVRALVPSLAGRPWAQLAILHGEGLYTPDSLPIVEELHRWRVSQGLAAIAIVQAPENPESAAITAFQFNKIYRSADQVPKAYFPDRGQAEAWLRSLGYAW